MLCLCREKFLVGTSPRFFFSLHGLRTNRLQCPSLSPWCHAPRYSVRAQLHSEPKEGGAEHSPPDASDVLGHKHNYDCSAFLPARSHRWCPSALPSSPPSLCCRHQQKPRAASRWERRGSLRWTGDERHLGAETRLQVRTSAQCLGLIARLLTAKG